MDPQLAELVDLVVERTQEIVAKEAAEIRRYVDASTERSTEKMREYVDASTRETRGYIDTKTEESKRHFDVVAEGLQSQLRLVAEGVVANGERIDDLRESTKTEQAETRSMVRVSFVSLDRRLNDLEAVVAELRQRVGRLEAGVS